MSATAYRLFWNQEALAKVQYAISQKMGVSAIYGDIGAGKRGAPMLLHVCDDEVVAGEMIHAGRPLRIIHRVRHVAH